MVKMHDSKFVSFDALPACGRQTDTPPVTKSRFSIAERDNKHRNIVTNTGEIKHYLADYRRGEVTIKSVRPE